MHLAEAVEDADAKRDAARRIVALGERLRREICTGRSWKLAARAIPPPFPRGSTAGCRAPRLFAPAARKLHLCVARADGPTLHRNVERDERLEDGQHERAIVVVHHAHLVERALGDERRLLKAAGARVASGVDEAVPRRVVAPTNARRPDADRAASPRAVAARHIFCRVRVGQVVVAPAAARAPLGCVAAIAREGAEGRARGPEESPLPRARVCAENHQRRGRVRVPGR